VSAQPERVSIESLCLTVTSGRTPSRANPRFWEDGVVPWFKTAELKDWYVDGAEERITEGSFWVFCKNIPARHSFDGDVRRRQNHHIARDSQE
jgi:hypothetical protein